MYALLLIDLQNDFLPGGALAVPEGDQAVAFANEVINDYRLIVATQDWHPADHASFASQHPGKEVGEVVNLDGLEQILWPDHCVQHTHGSEFSSRLKTSRIDHVVRKGTDRMIDSYSGFFDNARRKATGLHDYLQQNQVREVHLMGLATDYCVKFTALDAISLGYRTRLIREGCRGVNLKSDDSDQAVKAMSREGVEIV